MAGMNSNLLSNMKSLNKQINIQVSAKCNFACSYCFVKKENKLMPLSLIDHLIDFLKDSPPKKYVLHFTGGEPLLNFEFIEELIKKIKIKKMNNFSYFITTNGSLLNDKILNFLAKNQIGLEISFDGKKFSHLKNRKPIDDNFVYYDNLLSNIKKLKDKKIYFKINMVVSPNTVDDLFDNYLAAYAIIDSLEKIRINPAQNVYWSHEKITIFYKNLIKIWSYHVFNNLAIKDFKKCFIKDLLIKDDKEYQLTIKHNGDIFSDMWFKEKISNISGSMKDISKPQKNKISNKHLWQLDNRFMGIVNNFLYYYPVPIVYALLINSYCNNDCIHCIHKLNMKKAIDFPSTYINKMIETKIKDRSIIVLSGGEPTLHPKLIEIIDKINKYGVQVVLTTNAKVFYYKNIVKKLKNKKVLIVIQIHHAQEDRYDEITQISNSYKYSLAGIKNLKKINAFVTGQTVINKINYNNLKEIIRLYKKLNINVVSLTFPRIAPINIQKNVYSIIPKYTEVMIHIKEAVEFASKNNMTVFMNGFPYCILPGYNKYKEEFKFYKIDNHNYSQMAKCKQCIYNQICKGPDSHYIKYYGEDEFKPVTEKIKGLKEKTFCDYLNLLSDIIFNLNDVEKNSQQFKKFNWL
jgi:sulfatase maturation enzyme AslB (radical SAM superfamily)